MASPTGKTGDDISPVQDHPAPARREKAAEFLASHGAEDCSFTYEEEKAVVRRIDKRVLILILWAYFFQQLDKSSLRYKGQFLSR